MNVPYNRSGRFGEETEFIVRLCDVLRSQFSLLPELDPLMVREHIPNWLIQATVWLNIINLSYIQMSIFTYKIT
jgi:hypothetical protein